MDWAVHPSSSRRPPQTTTCRLWPEDSRVLDTRSISCADTVSSSPPNRSQEAPPALLAGEDFRRATARAPASNPPAARIAIHHRSPVPPVASLGCSRLTGILEGKLVLPDSATALPLSRVLCAWRVGVTSSRPAATMPQTRTDLQAPIRGCHFAPASICQLPEPKASETGSSVRRTAKCPSTATSWPRATTRPSMVRSTA